MTIRKHIPTKEKIVQHLAQSISGQHMVEVARIHWLSGKRKHYLLFTVGSARLGCGTGLVRVQDKGRSVAALWDRSCPSTGQGEVSSGPLGQVLSEYRGRSVAALWDRSCPSTGQGEVSSGPQHGSSTLGRLISGG